MESRQPAELKPLHLGQDSTFKNEEVAVQFVVGLNLIKGGAKAPRVLGGGIYETHSLVNCTYT